MLEINKHCLNSNFELEINCKSNWRIISNRCHFECNQENWHLEADLLKQCSILMKCHTMKIGGWMMPTLLSHRFNTTIARQFEFLLWHSTLFSVKTHKILRFQKRVSSVSFSLGNYRMTEVFRRTQQAQLYEELIWSGPRNDFLQRVMILLTHFDAYSKTVRKVQISKFQ